MIPVSSDFLAALRGSHSAVYRARVMTTYQNGTNPAGETLQVISGTVKLDSTADERSALDMTVVGDWPLNHQSSPLAPFGHEIYAERGIEGAGLAGVTEWVGFGYFRIETIEQDDAPRSPIRITGRDRMAALIEARMLEPRTFAAGTTFQDIFENLVLEIYPSAQLDISGEVATSTLREAATVDQDRYGFLRDMATSRGQVMYFDYRGYLVVKETPDPTVPVWTVDAGPTGVLINTRRQLSRSGVYNAVVAEGSEVDLEVPGTDPARGVAVDDDPTSATYFYGPYGQVPRYYASPLLFTDAQALMAANSILLQTTGLPYSLDLTFVPNPALEPSDAITVVIGDEWRPGVALSLPGTVGNYASTPDAASLDIVGDIDVRANIRPNDWTPAADSAIVSKSNTTGNQRSYQLVLLSTGFLRFTWSTNGIAATDVNSTVVTGFLDGSAHWVRATLAVATGTVTFYTSEDGLTWTTLGAPVVVGATSIFAGTAALIAGARSAGTADPFGGFVMEIQLYNGLGGVLVASPQFDQQPVGTTSFTDSAGKVWTTTGTASISATGHQVLSSTREIHVLDTLTIPLSSDAALSANTRATIEFSIT